MVGEILERAKDAVLPELNDRGLLNGVDDDLHAEIAYSLLLTVFVALSVKPE